jgi:hypothetical protein
VARFHHHCDAVRSSTTPAKPIRAIAVLDFRFGDKISTDGDFTVTMPAAAAATALLRFA